MAIFFGGQHGQFDIRCISLGRDVVAQMVNLGPIDFKLGLPLNISVNDGQNKFEVLTKLNNILNL